MAEESKPAQGLNLNLGARDQNSTPKADNADQTVTGTPGDADASARPAPAAPVAAAVAAQVARNPAGVAEAARAAEERRENPPVGTDSVQALDTGDKAPGEPLGESTAAAGPPVRLNIESIQATLDEGAAQVAVDRASVSSEGLEEGETIYSSHPIPNFALGPFQFTDGVIRLKGERLEQFEKLLNDDRLPASDRALIRKLDLGRVDAIVEARRLAVQGGFDSSVGRAALERLHQDMPTIGTQDISHAKRPQADNNVPVMPQPAVDPEGETGLDQGPHTAPEAGGDQQQVPGAQG